MKSKGRNFDKIIKIFDYFKEAYGVNRKNKVLYKPQLIYIGIQAFFIALLLITIYQFVRLLDRNWLNFGESFFGSGFLVVLVFMVFVLGIGKMILEPGVYAMYVESVYDGKTSVHQFTNGIKEYFWRFLGANLLIIAFWIVAAVPFLCLGIFTLFIAFSLITIAVSVFLATWKIDIVVNNHSTIEALKCSINFGKKHFIPMGLLVLLENSFTLYSSSGGGNVSGNYSSNFSNMENSFSSATDFTHTFNQLVTSIKTIILVLIPVITIATIICSIIKMIFEVFFALVFVVVYKNQFALSDASKDANTTESEAIDYE